MHLVASVRPSVHPLEPFDQLRPSSFAAKSNMSHYQFKMFVCVSLISGRMWIIARIQSISFLITVTIRAVVDTLSRQS